MTYIRLLVKRKLCHRRGITSEKVISPLFVCSPYFKSFAVFCDLWFTQSCNLIVCNIELPLSFSTPY